MAKTLEQIQAELETLKTQFTDFSALSPVSYYTHQYSGEEIDPCPAQRGDRSGGGDVGAAEFVG